MPFRFSVAHRIIIGAPLLYVIDLMLVPPAAEAQAKFQIKPVAERN